MPKRDSMCVLFTMTMHDRRLKVVIIDLGVGNLFSIQKACDTIGLHACVSAHPSYIEKAGALILPGVGAFGRSMEMLRHKGLVSVLKDYRNSNRPILGVCLGMQLLMDYSEEFGLHEGLGFISGSVKNLRPYVTGKIPHIGWSPVFQTAQKGKWEKSLLHGFGNNDYQYFVHSYFIKPKEQNDVLAYTHYSGHRFCSVVQRGKVVGCQFHPERSGRAGLNIYKQWALCHGLLGRKGIYVNN